MWDAGSGYVAGWWSVGVVWRGAGRWVCFAAVWVCHSVWWVRQVSAGLPFLRACALVPCPSGVPVTRGVPGCVGWAGVVPSALLGHLLSCPFASVLSPVLGVTAVSPSPSVVRAVVSVWWPLQWKVAGVVAWWLGFGGHRSQPSGHGGPRYPPAFGQSMPGLG